MICYVETSKEKRPRSLTAQLETTLIERIRSRVYPPGSLLPSASDIETEFGVSRTVVREALSRLNAVGLVETHHGIGTAVLDTAPLNFELDPATVATLDDVLAMLELRVTLESEAAALAAARRSETQLREMAEILDRFEAERAASADTVRSDFDFHLKVAEASNNSYFVDIMRRLGTATIPRNRLVGSGSDPVVLARIERYHRSIYDAISARDPETARTMMRMHLAGSRERHRRAREAAMRALPSPL